MTAALSWPDPPDADYTTADLHALPADGRRYELIDGSIIVSPSATIAPTSPRRSTTTTSRRLT